MAKLWAGRTAGLTDRTADDFNSSIRFDSRMYKQDITGSIAHAKMLGAQGIISPEEAEELILGLQGILSDMEEGKLLPDPDAEDIHMFVEQILTERIGSVGMKLHTARSRNDQVALDLRMYLRDEAAGILQMLHELMETLTDLAEKNQDAIMPGYTHLQRAQPVLFSHHVLAYVQMFLRDVGRLQDTVKRMNVSPIGCCALAGTTFDTDRNYEAELLGFSGIAANSLDGVSDRDFCLEFLSALAILMMHLSRFSEEIVLWSSWEFKFIELSDSYTTGSSIMPQKKNPDMAELVRGKCGRVYGDLMALLTTMKGLPLAYNKDMQEDKEAVFDALDTVKMCLSVFTPMAGTITVLSDNMKKAAQGGFINATDLADYLVKKGLPFREAYKISGSIVARCIHDGLVLETLPLSVYHEYSPLFSEDLYDEISLETCVAKRSSEGGTSYDSVKQQLKELKNALKGDPA
ncbi:MAG: argininosuccinate lyase [Lachnospiraceae bacterium]|nr:argininosuccinate lyase [Lachnospiraceae bacterium]